MAVLAAVAAMVLLVAAWGPAAARADGDPASDVLVSTPLFLPWDAGVPAGAQARLQAVLAAAAGRGFRVRVALIASPSDLGSVTALWRQPQAYAAFLGEELSMTYTGSLLVVMPDGFGLARYDRPPSVARAALAGVAATPGGGGLAGATESAVQRLAAASGHPLAAARVSAGTSSAPAAGSAIPVAWVVFGAGAALIVAAWTASLRARPPRFGRRRVSSAS